VTLAQGALLAAIYFGAARLAVLLAIPPGYATALWLPPESPWRRFSSSALACGPGWTPGHGRLDAACVVIAFSVADTGIGSRQTSRGSSSGHFSRPTARRTGNTARPAPGCRSAVG